MYMPTNAVFTASEHTIEFLLNPSLLCCSVTFVKPMFRIVAPRQTPKTDYSLDCYTSSMSDTLLCAPLKLPEKSPIMGIRNRGSISPWEYDAASSIDSDVSRNSSSVNLVIVRCRESCATRVASIPIRWCGFLP